jgi:formate-dependent nitrite reductase membrane component NrfD
MDEPTGAHPLEHGNGKPPGTTSWTGSVTELGTDMRSYYGRPVIKPPVWKSAVGLYLFTGGVAGASSVLHGLARVRGHEELARRSLYIGAVADLVSPVLLVSDLGRPERFLNMFRVFKPTSPMSVGSWVLYISGGTSGTAAVLEFLGILEPVKKAAEAVSFLFGPPLATYTGTLLANTAVPVWHEARHELPWLFGASACASAGAAVAATLRVEDAGPARRFSTMGAVAGLALGEAMERRLGFVGEVYKQGEAGRYGRIAKVCTAAGTAVLGALGRRSRAAAAGGSALVLAGELALRWSVFKAGFQSAKDPRYTVIPQRDRARARGTHVSERAR